MLRGTDDCPVRFTACCCVSGPALSTKSSVSVCPSGTVLRTLLIGMVAVQVMPPSALESVSNWEPRPSETNVRFTSAVCTNPQSLTVAVKGWSGAPDALTVAGLGTMLMDSIDWSAPAAHPPVPTVAAVRGFRATAVS